MLAPEGTPVSRRRRSSRRQPVLAIAINARTKADEDKLANALHRLAGRGPRARVERNAETHQTLLLGHGRDPPRRSRSSGCERKFGVRGRHRGRAASPYRETITGTAEAEGKYKKQTGGHGQFGVACLRVEPLERGAGFEFVDEIVGGAIPRQFIPAVEKGVEETMAHGGVLGFPVVDVKVTCFDGKYHPVDSSEMSFKMAGSLGFQEAMAKAGAGAARAGLAARGHRARRGLPGRRHGRPQRQARPHPGHRRRSATASRRSSRSVPTSEILRYAIDLRSMTGGRGRFTVEHAHYDPVPAHLVDRVKRDAHEPD